MDYRDISKDNLKSKLWRMEHIYAIEDLEKGELTELKMKKEQKILFDMWMERRAREDGRIKEIILKARQLGITTFALVFMFDDVLWNKLYKGAMIAHEVESAKKLFKKIKTMWVNYPFKKVLRDDIAKFDSGEISFKSSGSEFYVGLSPRGGTVSHLHVCLSGKTGVLCRNMEIKDIKDIRKGEIVMDGDGNDIVVQSLVVNRLEELGEKMVGIKVYGNPEPLRLTKTHKVLVKDIRSWELVWKHAKDVQEGEFTVFPKKIYNRILCGDIVGHGERYNYSKVERVFHADDEEFVYDLVLEKDPHTYVTTSGVVHNSEFGKMSAKYPIRATEVVTGGFPAVKQRKGLLTIESTAEGVGGFFYDLWTDPENEFNKHFFPWFDDPRYQQEPQDVPERFREIQKRFALDDRQISWYFSQYKDLKDLLPQEMPCSEEEAFLQSGRPVFSMKYTKRCVPERPKYEYSYAAGIDTAIGTGLDSSVLTIVCKETGNQVFTYRKKEPIQVFAKRAVEQCYLYNNALLNIELNGVGIAMKNAIGDQGYRNLYVDKKGWDRMAQKPSGRVGTVTTGSNKTVMIQAIRTGFEDGYLKLSDEKTWHECASYQYTSGDKMSAPTGGNDDCVMALAMAVRALEDVRIGKREKRRRVFDVGAWKDGKQKKNGGGTGMLSTAEKIKKGIY